MSETAIDTGYRIVVRDREREYPDEHFDFDPAHAIYEMHARARKLYTELHPVGLVDTLIVSTTPF